MKDFRFLPVVLLLMAGLTALRAAPTAHPDRSDRLVETRDGLTVEYSPGQEAWMEMAFDQMRKMAVGESAAAPVALLSPLSAKAAPGSARDLRERRGTILAAIARQVGLDQPTKLQGQVFETFLGYYELTAELVQNFHEVFPATVTIRRMAIWQRDDLVGRLHKGASIEGMIYDAATDSGRFEFKPKENPVSSALTERMKAIKKEIDAQRLKHRLAIGEGKFTASVTLGQRESDRPKQVKTEPVTAQPAADAPEMVLPIIYRGDVSTPPKADAFSSMPQRLAAARAALLSQAAAWRDANMVNIILHETAETGLIENIIRSRDRRWLCDGTANYVAWRVARDLIGPDFAPQVYNLEAQLRLHVASQPRINLVRWSAVEHEKEEENGTDLSRAHYAFATRVMFWLAERHGESALAQLWADVARTPLDRVSAKTFAKAYRKRFKADLNQLVTAAEKDPIATVSAAQR